MLRFPFECDGLAGMAACFTSLPKGMVNPVTTHAIGRQIATPCWVFKYQNTWSKHFHLTSRSRRIWEYENRHAPLFAANALSTLAAFL